MNLSLRNTAVPVLAVAVTALLAGCTTVGEPSSTVGSGTSASGASTSPEGSSTDALDAPSGLPSGISPDVAQSLCDDLGAQAQNMRTYTLTVGKVTLNTTVGTWTLQHNLNMIDLAQHREKVDQILEVQCPDVRSEVISALQIPDIASGLVGT